MKRFIPLILALSLLFSLAACAGQTEPPAPTETPTPADPTPTEPTPAEPAPAPEPEPAPAPEPDPYAAQLQLFADTALYWRMAQDEFTRPFYAVTDLNGNGLLELFASVQGGSGLYTWTTVFEVNETLDDLNEMEADWGEGFSEPDLLDATEGFPSYVEDGVRWLLVSDHLRNGYAEAFDSRYAYSLQNGAIALEPLGTAHLTANAAGDGYDAAYTYGEDAISQEDFEAWHHRFDGLQQETVTFAWFPLEEDTDLLTALTASWAGYRVA